MPRRLAYLLAWGVATTLTVGASWLGIASVLSAAAPVRTSPLSAADLHDAAPSPVPAAVPPPTTVRVTTPAPARTTRPAPSLTPTPTGTGWQSEPDGRGGTAYRRIFRMQGGEATIWFARGEIRVLSAMARPGFAVDVDRPALDSTTVTFYSSRTRSRVWAAWRSGPYVEVSEGR